MMRAALKIVVLINITLLLACSPVKLPIKNQYQLTEYSKRKYKTPRSRVSVLVTTPDAVSDYETQDMLYMSKPYELSQFAHNSWSAPPAEMLYPLIIQSLQRSNYFFTVASSPYAVNADFRLDTTFLKLYQNFIKCPSILEMEVKVVLTKISTSDVIASRLISEKVPAPAESPYGGVVAANKATKTLTAAITSFVVQHSHN